MRVAAAAFKLCVQGRLRAGQANRRARWARACKDRSLRFAVARAWRSIRCSGLFRSFRCISEERLKWWQEQAASPTEPANQP